MIRSAVGTVVFISLISLLAAPTSPLPRVDDGRVATVIDRQGTAVVQPAGHQRWTPLRQKSLLLPGDTVRTETRGANAIELELAAGGSLVIGPGSKVELVDATSLHVLYGEIEVTPGKQPLRATGPGRFDRTFAASAVLRASDRDTAVLQQPPQWLTGYRASTTEEYLGSLLAKVDGREVPLHLGYHKVDATIKDQLCETVIEESFVNGTDATLEGTFRFPLPADAAIAGFGMWVGDELVEADVVERQRARQIYEEILRRKQDPGLLEWAGGNIFQASVYPIPPHGEKRIRIRYTQVLAREGNLLRYRYALRSELTRAHPLRDLQIKVAVQSSAAIGAVTSPTHELQLQQNEHTATAVFSAQEYTPQRDFELQIPLPQPQPVMTAAQVADGEGWFLAWLSLPDDRQGWQRATTPESAPLDLVIVADTSGSMGRSERDAQERFVAALLQLLSPQDHFRLLTCDVEPHWFRDRAVAADAQGRQAALDFLAQRRSLGWTDLDAAFGAVAAVSGPDTTVVYVGDGIPTAGDADAAAQAQRLATLRQHGHFHAVATGSSYDQTVLRALAALGGSVREVGDDPAASAFALLDEAAAPALRNATVRFDGVDTAAVYPAMLPNLARGRQQIVVGRFDPDVESTKPPALIVTGMLDGKEQTFRTQFPLPDAGAGNSFVPRLWARAHVEALQAQGGGKAVRDAIVAASQRYGIITPLTSLLVLENDADRQEFGVARTVEQSDGEAFFAAARDAAQQDTLQQAMARAKSWRLQLRQQALRQIKALGGDLYGWEVAYGRSGGAPQGLDEFGLDAAGAREGKEMLGRLKDGGELEDKKLGEDANALEPGLAGAPEERSEFEAFDADSQLEAASKVVANTPAAAPARYYRGAGDSMPSAAGRRNLGRGGVAGPDFGFPALATAAPEEPAHPEPDWPAEVTMLLRGLDRRPLLQRTTTRLHLDLITTDVDDDSQLLRQHRNQLLWSPDAWVRRDTEGRRDRHQAADRIDYLHDQLRGVLQVVDGLARQRPAAPTDHRWPGPSLPGMADQDIVRDYRHWRAQLTARNDQFATVTLFATDAASSIELDIDPARQLLLQRRDLRYGQVQQRWRFAGIVEVAGASWVTTSAHEDVLAGRPGETQRLQLDELDEPQFANALTTLLAPLPTAIVLPVELPTLDAAREAANAGKADLAAAFVLLQHEAERARWPQTVAAWQRLLPLLSDRPGVSWLRARVMAMTRQAEVAGEAIVRLATAIAGDDPALAGARVELLWTTLAGTLAPARQLQLSDQLSASMQRDADPLRRYHWQLQRAHTLVAAARPEAALALIGELVQQLPAAATPRLEQANLLWGLGRQREAIAGLRQALSAPWPAPSRGRMFTALTDYQWQLRDLEGLRQSTATWIAGDGPLPPPQDDTAWLRWLSVLLLGGEAERADAFIAALAQQPLHPDSDPLQRAQLQAALQYSLGNGWGFYTYTMDHGEVARAMTLVRPLVQLDHGGFELARTALDNWRFQRSDAARELRRQLAEALLQPGAVTAMPLDHLTGMIATVDWSERTDAEREQLIAALRQRWLQQPGERAVLSPPIQRLLGGDREQLLAFLREQLQHGRPVDCAANARELFVPLAAAPWTAEAQRELLALVPLLADPWQPLAAQVRAVGGGVRKAADALLASRQQALLGDSKKLRQQPRAAQRQARAQAMQTALDELAAAFAAARDAASGAAAELLATETLCLRVRAVAGTSLQALRDTVEVAKAQATSLQQQPQAPLHDAERQRCRLVMAYAACSSKADAALIDAVLAFYQQVAAVPDDTAAARADIVRLLLALDRDEPLRATLQAWIAPPRVDRDARAMLAMLQAETGDVAAAAATLQQLENDGEVTADEYAALADWRLVLGDAAGRARAEQQRLAAMSTDELWRLCHAERNRITRRGDGVPDDLDPLAVQALQTLLAKVELPDSQLWLVRELYETTKDFRVVQALADGVAGHDRSAVFAFLQAAQDVLLLVHEEAALQALLERCAALESTVSGFDHRGLQWLAVLAALRAAEVPGVAAARAAELRQMLVTAATLPIDEPDAEGIAALLAKVGKFPDAGTEEVFDLLNRCVAALPTGSTGQLECALHRAQVQWQLQARAAAADGLLAILAGQRREDRLPMRALAAFATAQQYHLELGRYTDWERELTAETERQPAGDMRAALQRLRFAMLVHCLEHQGSCSLGSGKQLYDRARAEIEQAVPQAAAIAVPELVSLLCQLCTAAHKVDAAPAPGRDLWRFASGPLQAQLPRLLRLQPDMLQNVARTLANIDAPLTALRLLVQRSRSEPQWLARIGDDGWNQFHHDLANYRLQCRELGDIDSDLRQLVLQALDHELRSQDDTGSEFWNRDSSRYWPALQAAYFETAQQVLATTKAEPAVQAFVASYLWNGLHRQAEAIAALTALEQRQQLTLEWRWQLVRWLHDAGRFADSLRHLEVLIAAHPDQLDYRTAMVRALHRTGDDARGLELLLASEQRLRAGDEPRPEALAQLGRCAVDCEFAAAGVRLLTDAIRGREQQVTLTPAGDAERAHWYAALSHAHSQLGAAAAAVDAAGAAVVCAGGNDAARNHAGEALQAALHAVADLDAFTAARDAATDASGLDSPVVRKAIGAEYAARAQFERALQQYRLAQRLQPGDRDTSQRIAAVFDQMDRPAEAAAELQRALVDNPADAALALDLAERLQRLGDEAAAERARTQLVEPAPNDAAGHRALAELRDRMQQREPALVQWRHVVRLRGFEPDGWLGLARDAAALGDVRAAKAALQKVIDGDWPERFADAKKQAMAQLQALDNG